MPRSSEKPILLFDGECVLCSGWVDFILARERAPEMRFVAAQSPAGQALLAELGLPLTDWDSNFLLDDSGIKFKSDAAIAVTTYLRRPWPMARLVRFIPKVFRDWVYDRVAGNRYIWFGRKDFCAIPSPASADRFLV